MQSEKCNNNHNCPPLRFHADDGSEFSDWSKDTLGNLGTFDKGKTLSKSDISDSGTPMVLYGELYTRYDEIAQNIDRKTQHSLDDIYITRGHEVVIPCSGETAEDISTATCIIPKGVALGSDLIIYNSNLVAGEIISYILNHQQKWNIAKLAQGKSIVHISADLLKKLEIVYPTSSVEQQKIIAFFSAYDEKIALQKERVKILLEQKKGLLQKMFPQNGKTVPELRFPGFTGDWEQRKLGDIGKARSGVGFPNAEQGGVIGVPFFKVSDMNLDGNENEMTVANNYVTAEQIANHRWLPITELPAIFFAKVGAAVMLNRKRLCRFPFLLDNNTMAYSLSPTKWNADFAKALFETVDLTSLVQVGALPSYNAGDVESMEIYLPSLLEQEQIGAFFKQLDHLITLHQRKLELLKEIKKGLLQQMFC